jgi:hypothetical protein
MPYGRWEVTCAFLDDSCRLRRRSELDEGLIRMFVGLEKENAMTRARRATTGILIALSGDRVW